MDTNQYIAKIKDFFTSTRKTKAVVGLSGGVDSALTCTLVSKAIGAENVTALLMPEEGVSSQRSIDDARLVATQLGVSLIEIPLKDHLDSFEELPWEQTKLAHMNNKARIRMMMLYNYANTHGCLVVGTSNKTEILIGYGTKFGDAAADVYIIGDLLKKEVFALGKELGVPESILTKPPSAELFEGQTDEEELGMTYADIDSVLEDIALPYDQLVGKYGEELVSKVLYRIESNKHKGEIPTIEKA